MYYFSNQFSNSPNGVVPASQCDKSGCSMEKQNEKHNVRLKIEHSVSSGDNRYLHNRMKTTVWSKQAFPSNTLRCTFWSCTCTDWTDATNWRESGLFSTNRWPCLGCPLCFPHSSTLLTLLSLHPSVPVSSSPSFPDPSSVFIHASFFDPAPSPAPSHPSIISPSFFPLYYPPPPSVSPSIPSIWRIVQQQHL